MAILLTMTSLIGFNSGLIALANNPKNLEIPAKTFQGHIVSGDIFEYLDSLGGGRPFANGLFYDESYLELKDWFVEELRKYGSHLTDSDLRSHYVEYSGLLMMMSLFTHILYKNRIEISEATLDFNTNYVK